MSDEKIEVTNTLTIGKICTAGEHHQVRPNTTRRSTSFYTEI